MPFTKPALASSLSVYPGGGGVHPEHGSRLSQAKSVAAHAAHIGGDRLRAGMAALRDGDARDKLAATRDKAKDKLRTGVAALNSLRQVAAAKAKEKIQSSLTRSSIIESTPHDRGRLQRYTRGDAESSTGTVEQGLQALALSQEQADQQSGPELDLVGGEDDLGDEMALVRALSNSLAQQQRCRMCGAAIQAGLEFCSSCGSPCLAATLDRGWECDSSGGSGGGGSSNSKNSCW